MAILGAGSWGTALAIEFGRSGHDVLLWGRDPEVAARIEADGVHPRRLTGYPIPLLDEDIRRTWARRARSRKRFSSPFPARRCARCSPCPGVPTGAGLRLVSTAKGIEPESLQRMTEIMLERFPGAAVAALSGPTFAEGVARGDPTAAVVASRGSRLRGDPSERALEPELPPLPLGRRRRRGAGRSSQERRRDRGRDRVGARFRPQHAGRAVTRGLAEIGRIVRSAGRAGPHGPRPGGHRRPHADLHGAAVAQPICRRADRPGPQAHRRARRDAGGCRGRADVPRGAAAGGGRRAPRRRSPRPSSRCSTRAWRPRDAVEQPDDPGAALRVGRAQDAFFRPFRGSRTRIGRTIACRPANCSRRWIAKAVSLWRKPVVEAVVLEHELAEEEDGAGVLLPDRLAQATTTDSTASVPMSKRYSARNPSRRTNSDVLFEVLDGLLPSGRRSPPRP